MLTFVIAIVIIITDSVIAIVNVISIYIVIVIVITIIIIIVNVVVTNIVLRAEMTPCSSPLNVSEFCWIWNPSSEKHK